MTDQETKTNTLADSPPLTDVLWARISVNERRPEKMCYVLCACEGGNVETSFYNPHEKLDKLGRGRKAYGKYGRYFDLCKLGYKVTHWMPQPEAPNMELTRLAEGQSGGAERNESLT